MQTQTSPEQIEFIIGVIIGILFVVGIMAFAIVAIVKAFTKRTTGWIIAACISGAFGLFFFVCFAVGFVRGFTRGLHARQDAQMDSGDSSAVGTQTIKGEKLDYSIKLPSNWTIQRGKKDFDILANHGTLYVGVIAEEASVGTSDTVVKIARRNLEKVGQNIQVTDPTPKVIDGKDWQEFTVSCDVEKLPFFYHFYVYAGSEGTIQIVAWTFQNLKDKATPQMDSVANSFSFPK